MENIYFEPRSCHSQVEKYFTLYIVYMHYLFPKNLVWSKN